MYHSNLLLLLLSLLITIYSKPANPAMTKSFLATAELGTIWKNNPSILHNGFPDDNFSVRLILSHPYGTSRISVGSSVDSVPLFACGFFCAGFTATCNAYIFSIFIVNAFSIGAVLYLESPQVVWSANHDRPAKRMQLFNLLNWVTWCCMMQMAHWFGPPIPLASQWLA